jgi:regulator of replication initiation timing
VSLKDDVTKFLIDLYGNPAFRKGFLDFSLKLQQDGLEAARRFWDASPNKGALFDKAPELFEQMLSFYSSMGFVPLRKHEEVVKENAELKKENEVLKATIRELQVKVFSEGSAKLQESWSGVMEKQMEMSTEITKKLLDLFKKGEEKQG